MTRFYRAELATTDQGRGNHGTGFKADIDAQDWIISKVQHDVDSNGFTTQLNFEAKISDWIAETE
ncbi:TPA: hypothetical protein R4S87_001442 [Kluyvera cryocrescens]|nr:hypothetical protein [Kluyvera cryocrescens]